MTVRRFGPEGLPRPESLSALLKGLGRGPAVRWCAPALLGLLACRGSLSPLSNRLKLGQESYIVFVADGENGKGDLFASPPDGGKAFQITFTRVDERAPALSPDGSILALLRSRSDQDSTGTSLVILNLLNGAERRIEAPTGSNALAWSTDGSTLLVRTGHGVMSTPTPPQPLALAPVPPADQARTDSLFRAIMGDPPVGEAMPCSSGSGVCARLTNGDSLTLAATGSDPVSWGSDSVAYVEGGSFVVRPLAGGRTRTIRWIREFRNPRGLTYFPGAKVSGER